MCRLLLTSPRFNRSQREVIQEQAQDCIVHLEARGVKFGEGKSRQTRCERHRYVLQDGTRSPVCVRCGAPSPRYL